MFVVARQTTAATITTIGYEGRTADTLVACLVAAKVSIVADVRLTPLSRKPGLSKRALADRLHIAGIAYTHLPGLGNPTDNREPFRRGEPASLDRFRDLLESSVAYDDLSRLRLLAENQNVALICFERDATACHRSLVCEALQARCGGLTVDHLQ